MSYCTALRFDQPHTPVNQHEQDPKEYKKGEQLMTRVTAAECFAARLGFAMLHTVTPALGKLEYGGHISGCGHLHGPQVHCDRTAIGWTLCTAQDKGNKDMEGRLVAVSHSSPPISPSTQTSRRPRHCPASTCFTSPILALRSILPRHPMRHATVVIAPLPPLGATTSAPGRQ